MKTFTCNSVRTLGVFVVVLSLVTLVNHNKVVAQTNQLSDEMRITAPSGAVLFDNVIAETPPPVGAEPALTFTGGPASVPPPIPPAAAIGIPGVSIVVLTEPVGAVPEPGEMPIVITGPNGQIVVSDMVISTLGPNLATAPPFITFLSDGSPDLAQIAPALPGIPGVVFLPETGLFQDITAFVAPPGNPFGPITVEVRSDIRTPEPSGIVLALLAGVGLAAWVRRQRRR